MNGSVPAGMSKSAESVFGFFSIRIAMAWVFASALSTEIGTTAPFSAMSGAVIWTPPLSVDPLAPSALRVSGTLFVSKAALFHSRASACDGLISPAAMAQASTPAPPPAFSTSRRRLFMRCPTPDPADGFDFTLTRRRATRCCAPGSAVAISGNIGEPSMRAGAENRTAGRAWGEGCNANDPERVARCSSISPGVLGAAPFCLDVPGLVCNGGRASPSAVARAGTGAGEAGHQLRVPLLPVDSGADRGGPLRFARARRPARRRAFDHRSQPSEPARCSDRPLETSRRRVRDEGRSHRQPPLRPLRASCLLHTQRFLSRRAEAGGGEPPDREPAPAFPRRDPHDALAGQPLEGRSGARRQARRRAHSDRSDRDQYAVPVQAMPALPRSASAAPLSRSPGKAFPPQGQSHGDARRAGSLLRFRARVPQRAGRHRRGDRAAAEPGIAAGNA